MSKRCKNIASIFKNAIKEDRVAETERRKKGEKKTKETEREKERKEEKC